MKRAHHKARRAAIRRRAWIDDLPFPIGAEGRWGSMARKRNSISQARSSLYRLARSLGDVNAIRKGAVGRRLARRVTGKATGRLLGKLSR